MPSDEDLEVHGPGNRVDDGQDTETLDDRQTAEEQAPGGRGLEFTFIPEHTDHNTGGVSRQPRRLSVTHVAKSRSKDDPAPVMDAELHDALASWMCQDPPSLSPLL